VESVNGYQEAAMKAHSSLFYMSHCIIYELLIDPLYFQVCSYEAFAEAVKDYNTITMRLTHAIERLQEAKLLKDNYMQELS
jgi:hypothetical protein